MKIKQNRTQMGSIASCWLEDREMPNWTADAPGYQDDNYAITCVAALSVLVIALLAVLG
jgi:hypothetical protein